MSKTGQSGDRDRNGAIPPGKPDPATSTEAVRKVGRMSQTKAGPDGPSAAEVGDTFKRQGV
jgi:hypothetical protein